MCVKWIARESSPLFYWAMVALGTNATSSGYSLSRYQAIPCVWSATFSLFRLHSFHFETYCLQGCIPFRLRLFVFVNALHSVVKPHKLGFHNYAPFSTNKSLALRYCPHNTLDNTLSLYTSSSPRTPSHHAFVVTNRDIVGRLGTNARLGIATYFSSCVP